MHATEDAGIRELGDGHLGETTPDPWEMRRQARNRYL